MPDAILIVGGYGTVGTVIASHLARRHRHQLIIAGRNEARAASLAAELGPHVGYRVLDVAKPIDYDQALANVRWVVMCLDVPDIEFVRQCFQRGIHYADISAEYPILSAIAGLDQMAKQQGATALLSVGLVPGLSNLMARHSLRFVEPIEHFDSALLVGLGEKHGVAGSSWMLSHLSDNASYPVGDSASHPVGDSASHPVGDSASHPVGDGAGATRFQFREPYGQKTVYRFAFSDQYTLTQTLPIAEAATWLGFDSSLMTHLIGLARLPLLRQLFRQRTVKQLLLNTTQWWQFGADEYVLTTRARGEAGIYQAWLRGKREAQVTGLVTAEVVHSMILQQPPAGVFHIEQWFELEDFLPLLEQHGVTFSSSVEYMF